MAEKIKESDWRGFLAVICVIGFFVLLTVAVASDRLDVAKEIGSWLMPLVLSVLGFYFVGKSSEFSPEELKAITGK